MPAESEEAQREKEHKDVKVIKIKKVTLMCKFGPNLCALKCPYHGCVCSTHLLQLHLDYYISKYLHNPDHVYSTVGFHWNIR